MYESVFYKYNKIPESCYFTKRRALFSSQFWKSENMVLVSAQLCVGCIITWQMTLCWEHVRARTFRTKPEASEIPGPGLLFLHDN